MAFFFPRLQAKACVSLASNPVRFDQENKSSPWRHSSPAGRTMAVRGSTVCVWHGAKPLFSSPLLCPKYGARILQTHGISNLWSALLPGGGRRSLSTAGNEMHKEVAAGEMEFGWQRGRSGKTSEYRCSGGVPCQEGGFSEPLEDAASCPQHPHLWWCQKKRAWTDRLCTPMVV